MLVMTIQAVVFDIGGVLEITPDLGVTGMWESRLGLGPGELNKRMYDVWRGGGQQGGGPGELTDRPAGRTPSLVTAGSADVADVVLAEIRGVPCDRAVVGVIVQDGQAVMGGRGRDHEVYRRSAAVLAALGHVVLHRGNPAPGVLRHGHVGASLRAPPATPGCGQPTYPPSEWYVNGMRSTIDKAGRLVIPKTLRDSLGLVPGEVEITPDGAGLHIEPLADDRLEDEDGLLVIPAAGATVSDNLVRTLRDADQR